MSIWATRLFLKDERAPYEYDHYNELGDRQGDLEIAWPPGDYSSLRFCLNEEMVLLDPEQVAAVYDTLGTFLATSNTGDVRSQDSGRVDGAVGDSPNAPRLTDQTRPEHNTGTKPDA